MYVVIKKKKELSFLVKTKNALVKDIIDFTHFGCNHHKLMSTAVKVAIQNKRKSSIVVIGLGGGGLCMFLRKFLPNTRIVAVDIDADMLNVAKNWFGLKPDGMLDVKIVDGIKFLENATNAGMYCTYLLGIILRMFRVYK